MARILLWDKQEGRRMRTNAWLIERHLSKA